MKKKIIVAVFIVVILAVALFSVKEIKSDIQLHLRYSKSEGFSKSTNETTIETDLTDKPISETVTAKADDTPDYDVNSEHPYDDECQKYINELLSSDDDTVDIQVNQEIYYRQKAIYERDKGNTNLTAYMSYWGTNKKVTVRVLKATYYDELPELEGDLSKMTTRRSQVMDYKMRYLLVDIELENENEKMLRDVPVNAFYVHLINDNLSTCSCNMLYGTYQPGNLESTHCYFIKEMEPGEKHYSTLVFYVPTGGEFDDYGCFFEVSSGGYWEFESDTLIRLTEICEG